jgi:hypothetical protein
VDNVVYNLGKYSTSNWYLREKITLQPCGGSVESFRAGKGSKCHFQGCSSNKNPDTWREGIEESLMAHIYIVGIDLDV